MVDMWRGIGVYAVVGRIVFFPFSHAYGGTLAHVTGKGEGLGFMSDNVVMRHKERDGCFVRGY